jgi:trans-aconitate 2-methyltransferase
MLREAQRRLAGQSSRVSFIAADLTQRLPLGLPVDAILSTATFHWIADHDRLFANLAAAMRSGGVLAAQCGGSGNIARVRAVLKDTGDGWLGPWFFATPEETRARLLASGFTDVRTWLTEEPVRFDSSSELEGFLATVILGPHLDRLAPEGRDAFVKQVAAGLPDRTIDYVRLNIVATLA